MKVYQFNFPTRIRFGAGVIAELRTVVAEQKLTRPLMVTDRAVAELEFFKKIVAGLQEPRVIPAVYSEIFGNPVESQVRAGVEAYRAHHADSLVLIGGGAALDVGKAIALMVNHPGALFDYEDGLPNARPVDQVIPFMVAIPTTSGTGSEVGRSTVISHEKTKAKKIIFSPRLLPPIVLADPELTVGLPPLMTAATGFDALTHCVEAYLAQGYHPICDGVALEGVRQAATHLERAVFHPNDVDARGGMLMSAMMGAVAFQKGLGLTHSCAHALSTVFDLHHGLANAMMLKACMAFNVPAASERMTMLARTVLPNAANPTAEQFVEWVGMFKDRVGLPKGLGQLRVEITDRLLDVACADPCHPLGPRPVSREDFRQLYAASM